MSTTQQEQPLLSQATLADLPFLVELRRLTMTAHEAAAGILRNHGQLQEQVLKAFVDAKIVERSGNDIGLLKVLRTGSTWELVQIQLLPSEQGRGIGTGIIRQLIEEAGAERASVTLRVLKTNPARRLYERLGFVVTAERTHGIVMTLGPLNDVARA